MNNISNFSRAVRIAGVMGTLSLAALVAPRAAADLDVHVNLGGPPPPRHEVRVERDRPGPDYVWVDGYWGGSPGHYEWVSGHWDRPSHRGAVWVAPRWERRDHDRDRDRDRDHDRGHDDDYVFVKGYWR